MKSYISRTIKRFSTLVLSTFLITSQFSAAHAEVTEGQKKYVRDYLDMISAEGCEENPLANPAAVGGIIVALLLWDWSDQRARDRADAARSDRETESIRAAARWEVSEIRRQAAARAQAGEDDEQGQESDAQNENSQCEGECEFEDTPINADSSDAEENSDVCHDGDISNDDQSCQDAESDVCLDSDTSNDHEGCETDSGESGDEGDDDASYRADGATTCQQAATFSSWCDATGWNDPKCVAVSNLINGCHDGKDFRPVEEQACQEAKEDALGVFAEEDCKKRRGIMICQGDACRCRGAERVFEVNERMLLSEQMRRDICQNPRARTLFDQCVGNDLGGPPSAPPVPVTRVPEGVLVPVHPVGPVINPGKIELPAKSPSRSRRPSKTTTTKK